MMLFWIISAVVLLFGFVVAFGAPYVPSLVGEVRNAFDELYKISPKDVVVDLGSGDGLVLSEAAKRGAKGYGFELNPLLVFISRLRLKNNATVHLANMWNIVLPDSTTLVYAFVVSRDTKKLKKFLQSEANRLNRPLKVMTFGAALPGVVPKATLNGHNLYELRPLQ